MSRRRRRSSARPDPEAPRGAPRPERDPYFNRGFGLDPAVVAPPPAPRVVTTAPDYDHARDYRLRDQMRVTERAFRLAGAGGLNLTGWATFALLFWLLPAPLGLGQMTDVAVWDRAGGLGPVYACLSTFLSLGSGALVSLGMFRAWPRARFLLALETLPSLLGPLVWGALEVPGLEGLPTIAGLGSALVLLLLLTPKSRLYFSPGYHQRMAGVPGIPARREEGRSLATALLSGVVVVHLANGAYLYASLRELSPAP